MLRLDERSTEAKRRKPTSQNAKFETVWRFGSAPYGTLQVGKK
jgi:hypothetical protein